MLQVEIDVERWGIGMLCKKREDGTTCLCVLGYIAMASGVPVDHMLGKTGYGQLSLDDIARIPEGLRPFGSPVRLSSLIACRMISLNDDSFLSQEEKRERLARTALEVGVQLRFVEDRGG